jgi:hypothetical protein
MLHIMTLFIMQFSPKFLPLSSEFSSPNSLLKHPHSVFVIPLTSVIRMVSYVILL